MMLASWFIYFSKPYSCTTGSPFIFPTLAFSLQSQTVHLACMFFQFQIELFHKAHQNLFFCTSALINQPWAYIYTDDYMTAVIIVIWTCKLTQLEETVFRDDTGQFDLQWLIYNGLQLPKIVNTCVNQLSVLLCSKSVFVWLSINIFWKISKTELGRTYKFLWVGLVTISVEVKHSAPEFNVKWIADILKNEWKSCFDIL